MTRVTARCPYCAELCSLGGGKQIMCMCGALCILRMPDLGDGSVEVRIDPPETYGFTPTPIQAVNCTAVPQPTIEAQKIDALQERFNTDISVITMVLKEQRNQTARLQARVQLLEEQPAQLPAEEYVARLNVAGLAEQVARIGERADNATKALLKRFAALRDRVDAQDAQIAALQVALATKADKPRSTWTPITLSSTSGTISSPPLPYTPIGYQTEVSMTGSDTP